MTTDAVEILKNKNSKHSAVLMMLEMKRAECSQWKRIAYILAETLETSGIKVKFPNQEAEFSDLAADEWLAWAKDRSEDE